MKILMICTYFSPDTAISAVRPYMLAKYLTQLGHQVTVLRSGLINKAADDAMPLVALGGTNVISYLGADSTAERYETSGQQASMKGLEQSRISFLPPAVRIPIARVYHNVMRPLEVSRQKKAMEQRLAQQCRALDALKGQSFDMVFSTYGELENVYAGAYAAELFGCKWVLDFRDPISHHASKAPHENRKLNRIQADAVNSADLCTAVSQGLVDTLAAQSSNVPVRLLRNGYEEVASSAEPAGKEPGVLSFCYTGGIYSGLTTFEPLFQAIRQLGLPLNRLRLHYAGAAPELLSQQVKKYQMQSIFVNHGYLSRQETAALQAQSDIFLVGSWNHRNEGGVITGKFYEGIRSRTPILSLISGDLPNSELYQLNEQYHYGFCYESCRGQAHFQEFCGYLKQAFLQKMENGQVSYQPVPELFTDFRYDSLARQLESIFQELTEG